MTIQKDWPVKPQRLLTEEIQDGPVYNTYIANGFVSHNTTGTMVNTSTGIEPFFSWSYYRKSRLGLHEEQVPLVKEWYAQHPGEEHLPDYFVAAMDLAPEEHVRMQAAAQKWVGAEKRESANRPLDSAMAKRVFIESSF